MTHAPRKVFCIGFHKTGTSSFRDALDILGYRVTGPDWTRDPAVATRVQEEAVARARQFDAFQDNPWPLLYREMDEAFPDSLFVLTLRPLDAWIRSCVAHFGDAETPMRRWIYGVGAPRGHENLYRARHQRHLDDVRAYFATRPEKLLEFDLAQGAGWGPLCRFLGHAVPDAPFPHANAAGIRGQKGATR